MDIRQLRAGNLVTTNGKPAGTTKGCFYKVLDTNSANRLDELGLVGSATLQIFDGDYTTCVGAWVDYIEPIKINFLLLEKIGFRSIGCLKDELKISTYNFSIIKNGNKYILYIYQYGIIQGSSYINKGLNQLQNIIYDITGLELNVDNLITK